MADSLDYSVRFSSPYSFCGCNCIGANSLTQYIGYSHLHCFKHGAECPGGHDTPITASKVGTKLKKGQKFLKVGNSGSATTAGHLHGTLSNSIKGVFGITSQKQDLFKAIKANSWQMPFDESKVTSHYGAMSAYRKAKGFQPHSGTDWAVKSGTLIPSITDGEIVLLQYSKILGWVCVVKVTESKVTQKSPKQVLSITCPNCKEVYSAKH